MLFLAPKNLVVSNLLLRISTVLFSVLFLYSSRKPDQRHRPSLLLVVSDFWPGLGHFQSESECTKIARAAALVAQCSATPATVAATPPCSATPSAPFQSQISVRHLPAQGGGRCDTKIFRGCSATPVLHLQNALKSRKSAATRVARQGVPAIVCN